jgi:hypothetical protein
MIPKIGDIVTVKIKEEAYYSNYCGRPECYLEPTDRAVVVDPKVPKVCLVPVDATHDKSYYFCLVDFDKDGRVWRAGINYCNLVKVKKETP